MQWFDRTSGLLDAAILGSSRLRGAPDDRIETMKAEERLQRLARLKLLYTAEVSDTFLPHGPPIAPVLVRQGLGTTLTWPSAYTPWSDEVGADYLALDPANVTAHARMYAGARPGPVVVAIHGYGAGHARFEPLIWPVRAWRRAGLDVVMPTLPFHGPRKSRVGAPAFPAADPRVTHEGFRQAVGELTSLVRWLKERGHPRVSVVGMSLGGYTAALLATVSDDLHGLGLVVPLGCLATLARLHGRLGEGPLADRVKDALLEVYRPTSPLGRPSRIDPGRVRILAARGDRITGLPHAELLGRHFGVEPILCGGSHVVQSGLRWKALLPVLGRSA